MTELEKLHKLRGRKWSLESFSRTICALAKDFIVSDGPGGGSRKRLEKMTPRLVRHYQNQGCIDPPGKQGKSAFYGYRHLLQALLVRRLQSEGVSAGGIFEMLAGKTEAQYENLLHARERLTLAPGEPDSARDFLERIRKKSGIPDASPQGAAGQTYRHARVPSSGGGASTWDRLTVMPGCELHFDRDFPFPDSTREMGHLLQAIEQALRRHRQARRRSSRES